MQKPLEGKIYIQNHAYIIIHDLVHTNVTLFLLPGRWRVGNEVLSSGRAAFLLISVELKASGDVRASEGDLG